MLSEVCSSSFKSGRGIINSAQQEVAPITYQFPRYACFVVVVCTETLFLCFFTYGTQPFLCFKRFIMLFHCPKNFLQLLCFLYLCKLLWMCSSPAFIAIPYFLTIMFFPSLCVFLSTLFVFLVVNLRQSFGFFF